MLTSRIVTYLTSALATIETDATHTTASQQSDLSFDMCLARWALWTVETWGGDDSSSEYDLKKETMVALFHALGPGSNESSRDRRAYVNSNSLLPIL